MNRALAIFAACSMALNIALGVALYLCASHSGEATAEKRDTVEDAKACSDSVDSMAKGGAKRDEKHAPLIQAATKKAKELDQQSDRIIGQAKSFDGDACTRAQAEVDAWWKESQHAD